MTHVMEFTEEARQELLRRGEESLFFFARNILGFDRLNEWSYELCCALEGRHPYEPWIRFLLSQYRGSYKCEPASAEIRMADGTIRALGEIQVGDYVASYRRDGRACSRKVVAVEPAGKQDGVRISLRRGAKIVTSKAHRLFGPFGEVQSGSVVPGDWIKIAKKVSRDEVIDTMSLEEARLLGYMMADGCTTEHWNRGARCNQLNARLTNFSPEIVADFSHCAQSMGFWVGRVPREGSYDLRGGHDWIRRHGLDGCKATNKRVPKELFRQTQACIREFLAAFTDCDGHVSPKGVVVNLANEGLVRDLRDLGQLCGISGTMSRKYENDKAGFWSWRVTNHDGVESFPQLRDSKKRRDLKLLKNKASKARGAADPFPSEFFNALKIPTTAKEYCEAGCRFMRNHYSWTPTWKAREIADISGNRALSLEAYADWGWEQVVEVEELAPEEMIHIQVDETECYISGGVVSHNSTIATQSYPLWRGIYIENFSTKIIEGSADNAKKNHFLPLVDLFVSSPRAEFLQWLYGHRIPENFKGWNSESIVFNKTNPLASDAISYWGINSKFEGWHGNLVVIDDAQGTEVEGSEIGAMDAWRAYERAVPLLTDQVNGQIVVLGVGPENRGRSFVHEMKDDYDSAIARAA